MLCYRPAGQDLYFPCPVTELEPFTADRFVPSLVPGNESDPPPVPPPLALSCKTVGWVGGENRRVEVWSAPPGAILKVEGGNDFYIPADGRAIICKPDNQPDLLSQLDHEILLGPALVLALALRGVWSLHASAALFREKVIVFLGESGQGKSTLAAYLSNNPGWRLVADDILPVEMDSGGVNVLPHFPQLKLPVDAQPAIDLPERLPLTKICLLTHAESDKMPELQTLSSAQAVQSLLSHIAGTRMFDAPLLAKHLEFSTHAAKQIPACRLIYPHRRDTLPFVRELLEKIC